MPPSAQTEAIDYPLTASLADRSVAYGLDLLVSLGRLALKRVHRTRVFVEGEYNAGHWASVLANERWLQSPSLHAFLVGSDVRPRLSKVEDRIVRISSAAYYSYRLHALDALIARHAGPAASLVEIGAGYGYNLFALAAVGNWPDLLGLDIACNGIAAGRRIASHFALTDRTTFEHLDVTNARDPNFSLITGKTAFTYFCIEQIPYAVEQVIENIIHARPRRVINIEPTAELLRLTRPRDLVSYAYIRSVDYQTRLFGLLDGLDRSGRITIHARERMRFAPTFHNDGFLYCWEPCV